MKRMGLGAFFAALFLFAGVGPARSQSANPSANDKSVAPKTAPKVVLQHSETMQQAGAALTNANRAVDGNTAPSEDPANASSVNAVNGVARKTGQEERQLARNDSEETTEVGGSSYFTDSSISVPEPKSTGPKDHREGRAGTIWGAYSGYVAMAAFGMGFFGILFAAAGGYLFGSHLWHIEHPSS
ncbi:MAG: hypothetical protein KGI84_04485 [Elusimicrobia bacterium]|nr:hypothetical protein [Elusimicrobiota bacterium]